MKLPRTLKSDLRKTVSLMYGKEWFHPSDESGVVIAGIGESEPFPALFQYRVGTVAAGKLRYAKVDEARVGAADAVVVPFAQRETIDMIIGGIHPRLRDKLIEDVERWMPNGKNGKAKNPERIEREKRNLPATFARKSSSVTISPSWVRSRRCRVRISPKWLRRL